MSDTWLAKLDRTIGRPSHGPVAGNHPARVMWAPSFRHSLESTRWGVHIHQRREPIMAMGEYFTDAKAIVES